MLPRRTILPSILISSLLATACVGIGDILTLQNELKKKFGDEVNVNKFSGTVSRLTVTFINSQLNNKSDTDRFKRATDTVAIIKAHPDSTKSVDQIWVSFVATTKKFIFVTKISSLGVYVFDKDGRPLRTSVGGDYYRRSVAYEPSVSYLSSTDESDISISGIQLAGVPGEDGVTLLPHFKASGDARSTKLSPPKSVSFDFASYSHKQVFPEAVRIAFLAEGKVLVQVDAKFTTSQLNDSVTQFCYLTMPYKTFRRLTAGKDLTVELGDKVYPLSPEQFAGLKKMNDYVKP